MSLNNRWVTILYSFQECDTVKEFLKVCKAKLQFWYGQLPPGDIPLNHGWRTCFSFRGPNSTSKYSHNSSLYPYHKKLDGFFSDQKYHLKWIASSCPTSSYGTVFIPRSMIGERARYAFATPSWVEYTCFPKDLKKFKYDMADSSTQNFYILSYFHRGADGSVPLVCSEKGNLGVVKFLQNGDDESLQQALEVEQNRWKTLWQVKCRIFVLNGQLGLLMPFCMPFNVHQVSPYPFSSIQTWNKRSVKHEFAPFSDELEGAVNEQQLDYYQHSPLIAAKEALDTLSSKWASHEDLSLRHVALLPTLNSETGLYDFMPILIDLTRIQCKLHPQVAQSRAAEGFEKLKTELDEIKVTHAASITN